MNENQPSNQNYQNRGRMTLKIDHSQTRMSEPGNMQGPEKTQLFIFFNGCTGAFCQY